MRVHTHPRKLALQQGGTVRAKYTNDAAEKLAVAADRLEQQAGRVRKRDAGVTLQMGKEAGRLQRAARHVQTQADRIMRARKQRAIEKAWKELDRFNNF